MTLKTRWDEGLHTEPRRLTSRLAGVQCEVYAGDAWIATASWDLMHRDEWQLGIKWRHEVEGHQQECLDQLLSVAGSLKRVDELFDELDHPIERL